MRSVVLLLGHTCPRPPRAVIHLVPLLVTVGAKEGTLIFAVKLSFFLALIANLCLVSCHLEGHWLFGMHFKYNLELGRQLLAAVEQVVPVKYILIRVALAIFVLNVYQYTFETLRQSYII